MYEDFGIRWNNAATWGYEAYRPVEKRDESPTYTPKNQNKKTDNLDEPVPGYSIEKTADNKEENETITVTDDNPETLDDDTDDDHSVNPHMKIHTHKRFRSNTVTNALNNAVYSDLNNDEDGVGAHMVEADQMLNDSNSSLNEIKSAPMGFHMYTKPVAEFSHYSIADGTKYDSNAFGLDIGGTWTNKKNNTHSAFFFSGTRVTDNIKIGSSQNTNQDKKNDNSGMNTDISTPDDPQAALDTDSVDKTTDFKGFIAADHTFKNEDELLGYLSYKYDASAGSTSNIGVKYISNKYGAYVQGQVTLYHEISRPAGFEENKNGNTNSVITNFKVGFNNDAAYAYENMLSDQPAEEEQNTNQENTSPENESPAESPAETPTGNANKNKKFEVVSNPFIDLNKINGNRDTGLGYEQIFKKSTSNSAIALGYFGKGSVINEVDENGHKSESYSITVGGNLKYAANIGSNTIEAKAKIRNKYTIGQENILTAQGNVSYQANKFSAEIETVYTKVPNSTYRGVVTQLSWLPKDNIKVSLEADYLNWEHPERKIKGGAVVLSSVITF